ncbi:hypothetical protein CLH62_10215 [Marinobacter guineae]|uniref:C4-dicarboxylate ABC transporter n=1 Tax=Marinobacter guineae TaxID=432303 RepID=A0A2G1VHG7_9GAMM|nr:hypothetical protein [Marinobacter guineae]PHQ25959.1 hypothetical protein CLH62_10215 [Marinobacter guineae]
MTSILQWLVSLAVVTELVAICLGHRELSALAGIMFVSAFLAGAGRLQGYARMLLVIALVVLGALAVRGTLDAALLVKAASDAAFYAAFLGSLGMMQCLVRRFEVLRRIHDVLLGGKPLLLYPKYALVSCGIATVLSFGMMNLLCGTLSETLRERGITGDSRLQWLRSVLISALRGFALVPLVAPTSVAVAILTRELPQLSWSQLLPFGLIAALLMVLVGWVLEQRRFRKVSSERIAVEGWLPGTGRLLALILVVFAVMAGLVATTGFKVSVAAMLAVPTVTLLYMFWQERRLMPVLQEGVGQVWTMHNEMAIFAASAILGVALSAVIPADALAGLVATGGGVFLVAMLGMLMMPMFSMIGVIPITVLSVQAGLLPQLVAEGMDLLPVAVALVIGFSLAMMLSPFGPSVMLLSRFGQISRWVVAFRWNGLFVLIALPLLLVLTALVAWLAPTPA